MRLDGRDLPKVGDVEFEVGEVVGDFGSVVINRTFGEVLQSHFGLDGHAVHVQGEVVVKRQQKRVQPRTLRIRSVLKYRVSQNGINEA